MTTDNTKTASRAEGTVPAMVRTFNPPCWAWISSKVGIKRTVWVHHIAAQYASVSYSRREAKRHAVLTSDLRTPEERSSPNAGTEARVPPSPPVTVGRPNQTTKGE